MTELFKVVLEMSVTGAIIIATVMLIRLCMKRLPRRYAYFLWIIPAIRLLCPLTVSSEASLFNLFPTQSVQVEYEERVVTEQTVELPETAIPQETTPIVTVHYPEQPAQPSQPQDIVNEKQPTEEAVQRKVSAISVVSVVWLTGAAAMLVYVASSYIRTYRKIRSAALLQNNIFISHSIDTPFVFGLIKPKIYIPDGISGMDLQYILAHENAHIKRLDHAAKLLAMVILSVHWFNPLVWLGFKLMTDDMEFSCDEKALGSYDVEDRKAYATTLLNMSVRQNRINLGGMLSFGESGIKARIKGVLAMKKPRAIACVLAVAVIIAAAVCLLTSAEQLVIEDSERGMIQIQPIWLNEKHMDRIEFDSSELAVLLNSFDVKKVDRDEIFRTNQTIKSYEVVLYKKDNLGYDQIHFLSPACEDEYVASGNKSIFKYIRLTKLRVKNNEPHAENEVIYQLTDSDYDKLCKAIVPKFEAFPEGCYVSDVDSDWKVYVEYENGEPWFDIQHYNKSMMKVFPDHTDTYGLVKKETQTEMTLRYFGNGVLNIEPTRTNSGFMGDFIWKGKAEDITEDDYILQANTNANTNLGSFVIEKTAVGYEAHSPLTDIYIKFTEDDHSQLFLCRKNASGGTDEYIYDYRGGFYPHRTEIQLYDITGDGVDDLMFNKMVTGTGAVDSIFIAVDGSSMKEIPVYRIGAEKMIAEMSEELLEGEKFEGQVYLINGYMPEMDYEYIYPYYPDTSVKRYGGMSYHFTDGKLIGVAAVGFIRNDKEHSETHYVRFEHEYIDGSLIPVSAVKMDDTAEITESPFEAVMNYYKDQAIEVAEKDIKIGQINSTVTWQYKSPPLSEKFGIAEESEIIEAIVDYTANGASQSVVAVIESNQQFGFRVVDTFPYEPMSLYGTILEVTETDIDGSKQFYIVQPADTSDEVRVYSFAMYGDYITGDATNTFNVGDKVEVKYNGTLEYGREGNNRVFSMMAVESRPESELEICTNYLNEYWNFFFKTGSFTPENYISDLTMLTLANARRLEASTVLGHNITNVEIDIDESSVQSGINDAYRPWIYFVYDLQLNMEEGISLPEGNYYQGYTAYFEFDSDGRIFREYKLHGSEKEALGLDDNYTLPLGNTDIHAVIDSITEELAPEKINPKPYTITSQVYKAEEHGYSPDNDNNTQLEISFELPENWDFGGCTADLNGSKIFEIGVPYPESQGINYDNFKTDEVVGREITVYGEKIGTDSDPFEYYINTSSPDYYSDDGTYDMYGFVVNSGGYNLYMHFVADAGVEYAVFEQVLRSVTIRELSPAVESNPVADPDYIPDADEVFHTAVNPAGTAYNIQFEKLAGTEDAKDLNKYKDEILTCINKSISAVSDDNIRPMRSSDIDFNNEELVQGVKVHGVYSEYSPNASYDKVMSALESESFRWEILIQNEYTGAKLSIHHCNNDKCPGYRFGDDWCIQLCDTSRATSKTHSTAADLYAEYAAAEEILNKYVKANKNDDIKVVYASIGRPLVRYYLNGGIVFINGVAKYIYSSGFAVHYDRMKPETPEDIVQKVTSFDDLYLVRSSIAGSTDYEGIFNYNEVMSVINVYEKYSMYTE